MNFERSKDHVQISSIGHVNFGRAYITEMVRRSMKVGLLYAALDSITPKRVDPYFDMSKLTGVPGRLWESYIQKQYPFSFFGKEYTGQKECGITILSDGAIKYHETFLDNELSVILNGSITKPKAERILFYTGVRSE
ncbi:hypothetical protein PQC06_gp100 [Aeromonas phage LAh10]|uniref:Uncharacterized protein n=1 Tax=Aeromonas phage LAh10 TaxID=2591025 RepID=A0A514A1N5_9CAUD|nr:hypothetical protein PQC06_gp100 [Aeromonas phage LAh10]QDH47194.1 hypothetical protein LAh10_100 [Aeromonas phage LAh10]